MYRSTRSKFALSSLIPCVGVSLALHVLAGVVFMRWTLSPAREEPERILVRVLPADPPSPRKLVVEPRSNLTDQDPAVRDIDFSTVDPAPRRPLLPEEASQVRSPKIITSASRATSRHRRRPALASSPPPVGATLFATNQQSGDEASGEGARREIQAYLSRIQKLIRRQVSYPYGARSKGTQGTVVLLVNLGKDGALIDAAITSTSGSQVLDDAALKGLRRSAPFPPCPVSTSQEIEFSIPIVFRLEG